MIIHFELREITDEKGNKIVILVPVNESGREIKN